MGVESAISWTHATYNPWRGCVEVSAACDNCYAREMGKRNPKLLGVWGDGLTGTRVVGPDKYWSAPIGWNARAAAEGVRRRVFCASLADVFEDWNSYMRDVQGRVLYKCVQCHKWFPHGDQCCSSEIPFGALLTMNDVRMRLFRLIDATPNLDWLLLTKRPENILKMWAQVGWPDAGVPGTLGRKLRFPNVWLGTTVENQEQADKRIPELLKCRDLSPVLWLSCEPLLGPVDLRPVFWFEDQYFPMRQSLTRYGNICGIDWVIAGGESGPHARPSHPDWFRDMRNQCGAARVPFHFKQWGEYVPGDHDCVTFGDDHKTILPWHGVNGSDDITPMVRVGTQRAGRLLDDVLHDEFPKVAHA